MSILAAFCSIFLMVSAPAQAQASRGSGAITEGEYFTIKTFEGLDVTALLNKLNYDYFAQVDTFLMKERPASDPQDLLGRNMDAIYREVENVLGLQVPLFHGTITICPDKQAVHQEFRRIYGMDFRERSFYVFDSNTIFISYQDLTLGMLGHEIAHAVISGYFVVPPPDKVQEVLAGYVEYSLRKAAR